MKTKILKSAAWPLLMFSLTPALALADDPPPAPPVDVVPAPVPPVPVDAVPAPVPPPYVVPAQPVMPSEETVYVRDEAPSNFYIIPEAGVEIDHFGTAILGNNNNNGLFNFNNGVGAAPTVALAVGGELGPLNIGLRYQRAMYTNDSDYSGMNLNKLYGEIGVNGRYGITQLLGYVDFGWAFIDQANSNGGLINGMGGKIGGAVDFWVTRWLTLGPGVSFDLQGYRPVENQAFVAAYGGTFLFRLGFHVI